MDSFIHSYSQMFFSDNRIFAWLILLSTFMNFPAGLSGICGVIFSLVFARWMGLNKEQIHTGFFSFNGLMVGLVMGMFYQFSLLFFVLLFVFCMLSVLLTHALGIVFSKYSLPVLGLPFVLTMWMLLFTTHGFQHLLFREAYDLPFSGVLQAAGFTHLSDWWDRMQQVHFCDQLEIYFKSLGAIYFQFNTTAGILIALGLLIYSRIAFSLSVIGFLSGYYSYLLFHGSTQELSTSYLGFNYVLAAVSIGGFYLIPTLKSYSLAVLGAVIISVLISCFSFVLLHFHLPMYSLPASLFTLLTLLSLRNRERSNGLKLVPFQLFSPEKNLYRSLYQGARNRQEQYFPVGLPFYGEWYVSQGHEGKLTHRGDWQYAWDFVVTDEMKKTFRLPGDSLQDFFCYNVPVTAPAAGYVTQIIDDIDDNEIGGVNLQDNWGNSIIIRHAEGLYTEISHLKKGSFRVKTGDYVYAGDILASCGNSGRSPEPHIHFQIQAEPKAGAKTVRHPIGYYVMREGHAYSFHSFSYPKEGATLENVIRTPLLQEAFGFYLGQQLTWELQEEDGGRKERVSWEVKVDIYNQLYLYCAADESCAYFVNNYTVFYFTEFYGNRKSLLYRFYLSAHQVLLGYYPGLRISDRLPVNSLSLGPLQVLQDFAAPFVRFRQAGYEVTCSYIDDLTFPQLIHLETTLTDSVFGRPQRQVHTLLILGQHRIQQMVIRENHKKITATCISN